MRQVDVIPYKKVSSKKTVTSVFLYLATPIKHDNPTVELDRCEYATQIASFLHDAGIPVFSPASHGGPISSKASQRRDWSYWSRIDLPILSTCCTHLLVICSPGWSTSTGVSSEILTAGDIGIPVIYYDPDVEGEWVRLESIVSSLLEEVSCG